MFSKQGCPVDTRFYTRSMICVRQDGPWRREPSVSVFRRRDDSMKQGTGRSVDFCRTRIGWRGRGPEENSETTSEDIDTVVHVHASNSFYQVSHTMSGPRNPLHCRYFQMRLHHIRRRTLHLAESKSADVPSFRGEYLESETPRFANLISICGYFCRWSYVGL